MVHLVRGMVAMGLALALAAAAPGVEEGTCPTDCQPLGTAGELSLLQVAEGTGLRRPRRGRTLQALQAAAERQSLELEVPGLFRVRRRSNACSCLAVQSLNSGGSVGQEAPSKRRIQITLPGNSMSLSAVVPLHRQGMAVDEADRFANVGKSSILVMTLLIEDGSEYKPEGKDQYKSWIVKVLNHTAGHMRRHGHTLGVRTRMTMPAPKTQEAECRKRAHDYPSFGDFKACMIEKYRENANWEKFRILQDYFTKGSRHFSHILFLDVDATPMNPDPAHDTVRLMAEEMDRRGVSLLMADEDWRGTEGTGRLKGNGGVMMWKATDFSKTLLKALATAHYTRDGKGWSCPLNEQLCLSNYQEHPDLANFTEGLEHEQHTAVLSGLKWNRHPCVLKMHSCTADQLPTSVYEKGLTDPELEIMHFMGGAKGAVHGVFPSHSPV